VLPTIDISDDYPQNAGMRIASLDASEDLSIVMLLRIKTLANL
jgi:hypothetical protein